MRWTFLFGRGDKAVEADESVQPYLLRVAREPAARWRSDHRRSPRRVDGREFSERLLVTGRRYGPFVDGSWRETVAATGLTHEPDFAPLL
jgi:hypothetical protein